MQHVGWTQLYLCGRQLMPSIALPLTAQYQKLRQKRWICSDTDIFVGKVCLLDVDCLSLFDEEVEYNNNNNNNNHLTAVCPGQPVSASTRRNIHPLTPILVNVLPLSPFSFWNGPWHPLYSAYVLTVLSNNLFPGPLWSSPWSWTLNFILHTFLHPVIVIFSQHMPIPTQPVLLQYQCYVIYT